jgi:predicted RND superfamily exporter protein
MQYIEFKKEFGNDHILLLGIELKHKYDESSRDKIDRISREIELIPEVDAVSSISAIESLNEGLISNFQELNNAFLTRDSLHALLIIQVSEKGSQELRSEIIKEVKEIIGISGKDFQDYNLSGSLYMGTLLDQYSKDNTRKVLGFTYIGIAAVLLLLFQNFRMIIILLMSSSLPVVWSLGFIGLTGQTMNLVTNIIIPLILTISLAFSIHIVIRVSEEVAKGPSSDAAIIQGVSKIWLPGFLSTVTTAAGLFSLYFSPVEAVSKFGINATAGILMQFICVINLLPVLLSFIDTSKLLNTHNSDLIINRFLNLIIYRLQNFRFKTIIVFSIVTALMLFAVFLIKINSNQLKYFNKKSDVVTSAQYFDHHFGGTFPLQIVLSSYEDNKFLDYNLLSEVSKFQDSVCSVLPLERRISFADIIARKELSTLSQMFLFARINSKEFLSEDDSLSFFFRKMINKNKSKIVLSFLANSSMSSNEMIKVQDETLDIAYGFFTEDEIRISATGILPLYAHFHEYMVSTQSISFAIAFIIVVIIIALTFKSVYLLIPVFISNLSAIIVVFGLMGLLKINLDVGTVMLASIALGITIDDTIHLLFRAGQEKSSDNNESSFSTAIWTTGKALIYTSVILSTGFLMLLFIDFKPVRFFGFLSALIMLSGLLADILFLPALILHFKTPIRNITQNRT